MGRVNKAQRGLEELESLGRHGETAVAQAEQAQARLLAPPHDGEAKFATADALQTAVGAGWILGPAGGLLLGLAQGYLGKREQQNAIDAYMAEMKIVEDVNQVFSDELDRVEAVATSEDDLEQLSTLRATKDAAIRMMQSTDPDMQAQGETMLAEFDAGLRAYQKANEEQRIETEVRDAQIARDLDQYQQGVQQTLLDDYDAQSSGYETIMASSNNALEMVARGNPVDIVAALIQVNKALDPTSVVRPEEAKALGNVGTLIEQAITQLDEWGGSGQALSKGQREDLATLVEGIRDQARGFQIRRDIRFQQRAVDAGLPMKYVDDFRLVDDLPAFTPKGFQERTGNTGNLGETLAQFSDQAIVEGVVKTLGLDEYEPKSLEEMAKDNPRVRRALRTN